MQQAPSFSAWLRRKRGTVSQQIFAAKIGIDAATLSRLEREKTQAHISTAVRICSGLDLSLASLCMEWLGTVPESIPQQTHMGANVLCGPDVQCWFTQIVEGHQRHRELLVSALNFVGQMGQATTAPSHFVLADIEKVLRALSPVLFFAPLQQDSIMACIRNIAGQRGLVLSSEIGAYIRLLRSGQGLSLPQLGRQSGLTTKTLSHIEASGFGARSLLCDLVRLDRGLGQDGALLSLVWWQVTQRHLLEEGWQDAPYSLQGKRALASLLISVGRWLQHLYRDDSTWLAMIRHEVGSSSWELPSRREP